MNPEDLEWTLCGAARYHTFIGNMMVHKWLDFDFFCIGPEGDGLNEDVSLQFSVDYQHLVKDSHGGSSHHSHIDCVAYPSYSKRIPCVESKTWEGVLLILSKVEEDIARSIKEAIYA